MRIPRAWLYSRTLQAERDRRGSVPTQLGVLEAHFALCDGRLDRVMLAGDFLANATAVAQFEGRVTGSRPDRATIAAAAFEVFGAPGSYLLGAGDLGVVARAFSQGLG